MPFPQMISRREKDDCYPQSNPRIQSSAANAWCFMVLVLLFSSSAFAEEGWVEGQHYQTLNPPVAVGRGDDVIVTEFFWYGCGHCYTFEPMLTAWGKQLPEGAVVKPSPAVWNEPMRMHAKAYFIAEVLDVKATMHPVIFDDARSEEAVDLTSRTGISSKTMALILRV